MLQGQKLDTILIHSANKPESISFSFQVIFFQIFSKCILFGLSDIYILTVYVTHNITGRIY